MTNVTEASREGRRRDLLAGLDTEDMIVFAPEGVWKAVVHVFTDVDCPYCRKLHSDMGALNGYGIEVRYLAYPRAGPGSEAFDKMVSAWCSADRRAAITELKLGNPIPAALCESPVGVSVLLARLRELAERQRSSRPTANAFRAICPLRTSLTGWAYGERRIESLDTCFDSLLPAWCRVLERHTGMVVPAYSPSSGCTVPSGQRLFYSPGNPAYADPVRRSSSTVGNALVRCNAIAIPVQGRKVGGFNAEGVMGDGRCGGPGRGR